MDMFGDSSVSDTEEVYHYDLEKTNQLNEIFLQLVKLKPVVTVKDNLSETILPKRIAIVCPKEWENDKERASFDMFLEKLKIAHFEDITTMSVLEAKTQQENISWGDKYDILVWFEESEVDSDLEGLLTKLLTVSGILIINSNKASYLADSSNWCNQPAATTDYKVFRHQDIVINKNGCIYWTGHADYDIKNEYNLIDKITVRLTQAERKHGTFSSSSHAQAVKCLDEYGICIISQLFDPDMINVWGKAATVDMIHAVSKLQEQGIDMLKLRPDQHIENFYELSMREAYRVDLRNGKETKKANKEDYGNARSHPAIKKVMLEVMNPIEGEHFRGNWGKWNFEGEGPETLNYKMAVGEAGAVISLPKCVDQTIHADIAHTYTHVHLPGHYFHFFLPATTNPSMELGQTVYVLSSHKLEMSEKIMVKENGQKLLESQLIRPQLQVGDALIFDCRILHFGLANQSTPLHEKLPPLPEVIDDEFIEQYTDNWRVMIYIDHHQPWFHDPKNWNERERIFN